MKIVIVHTGPIAELVAASSINHGIKNVLAKSKGSSNPHNLVKATFAALLELRDAHTVAQQRSVSLDKVFNG